MGGSWFIFSSIFFLKPFRASRTSPTFLSTISRGEKADVTAEQRRELAEGRVGRVRVPRLDEYPVVRLSLEVLGHVVHDDHLLDIAPDAAQVFYEMRAIGDRMLPVDP